LLAAQAIPPIPVHINLARLQAPARSSQNQNLTVWYGN